ncbi:MAG TPA: HEAT repeat domain-containing protein [Gemmatimonadales bacterium]|nr:HEAT repeat domain-containing protein [Gemmatimonadales bacterium]
MTEPRSSGPRATTAVQIPVGPPPEGPDGQPLPMHPQRLEEVFRTFVKALRAIQMYLPNNPIYQRAVDTTRAAFQPVWDEVTEVNISVHETELVWEGQTVYSNATKNESIAWLLFKDGIRSLTFRAGVEDEELVPLLEVLNKVRTLPQDAEDDLLTLLWEHDFQYLQYQFVEVLQEGVPQVAVSGTPGLMPSAPADNLEAQRDARQQAVREEAEEQVNQAKTVRLEDFDSTLYFLDEAEVAYIKEQIAREYSQDLRANAMAVLYDLFETQTETAVREEIIGILESFPPYLMAAGDLRAVAEMLREAKVLALRARNLEDVHRDRLEQFSAVLSEPAVVEEMLQAIEEAVTPPPEADLAELFRELRGTALEPVLSWLPKLTKEQVRQMLERVVTRLAESYPADLHKILGSPESPALPGAVALAGRLKMQSAVAGLGQSLTHADPAIRLASAQALGAIGSPGALQALERGLGDEDREVRLFAVRVAAEKGYKGALRQVEALVLGKNVETVDLTERQAFFEAFARIAGNAALAPLLEIAAAKGGMFKKSFAPETRVCAVLGLSKMKNPEARSAIEKLKDDKEVVVRNAVTRALREMGA